MAVIMMVVMIISIITMTTMTTIIYFDTDSALRTLHIVAVGSVTDVSEVHVPPSSGLKWVKWMILCVCTYVFASKAPWGNVG
jgi:ABC-type cobalamin transport system permease subunit